MFIVAVVVAVVAVVVVADTSADTNASLLDVDVVDTTAAVADTTAVGFVLLVDVVDVVAVAVVAVVVDTSAGTPAVARGIDVTLLAWQMIRHVFFSYVDTHPFVVRMILYKNHT